MIKPTGWWITRTPGESAILHNIDPNKTHAGPVRFAGFRLQLCQNVSRKFRFQCVYKTAAGVGVHIDVCILYRNYLIYLFILL